MRYTKAMLEEGVKKKKIGLSGRWAIKMHLQSDPLKFDSDAWEFLIAIAKREGFSETEIKDILSEAAKNRQFRASTAGLAFEISVGLGVCLIAIFIGPLFNISMNLGISASIALTVGAVWILWKRGY